MSGFFCCIVVTKTLYTMEKREVKLVRLFPSEGKRLKVTIVNNYNPEEPTSDFYCDDGHIIPEDEIIAVNEVSQEEWEEGRKNYCIGVRCF